MIFAVLDPSPLTVCINCSFLHLYMYASPCQISRRSVKSLPRYGRFVFFKMAAVCHLGFLKARNYNCPYPSEGQFGSHCQISCSSVKPLPRYRRFSIFKMVAIRHLGVLIVENFNCPQPSVGRPICVAVQILYRTADRSSCCGDKAVCRLFKMAAVLVLDL